MTIKFLSVIIGALEKQGCLGLYKDFLILNALILLFLQHALYEFTNTMLFS